MENLEPLAEVGLVYSQRSAAWVGGDDVHARIEAPILGAYQALVESRIPFEMVHDGLMDEEHLRSLKALVLPNIPALSEKQCEQLRAFVARGGGLVATWETSLFTENGAQRENFGLADLLGVDLTGPVEGPLKNTYLNIEHASPTADAILPGLKDAKRIIHGAYRVPIEAHSRKIPPPLTLVPPYPDLPMEEVYPRQRHTDIPGLVLRQVGRGRVAYFPWDIARTFWEVLNPDLGLVFGNTVRWALDAHPVVQVNGPGLLDITAWRQEASMTVHLVNLTNPMAMRGAFRETYPVGPLEVSLRLPVGAAPKRVHLLRSGIETQPNFVGNLLTVQVVKLRDYEVIAVDFSS